MNVLKTVGTWLMWITTVAVLLLRGADSAGALNERVQAQADRIARLEAAMQNVATKDDISELRRAVERIEDRLTTASK
jgi:predicted  nucleic acid-binding Zn-ribbon protein